MHLPENKGRSGITLYRVFFEAEQDTNSICEKNCPSELAAEVDRSGARRKKRC